MNTRVIVATVVGAIVMFICGFLIFGLALSSFMKAHINPAAAGITKEMPDMLPLALSNLAFSWVYAFVFDYWAGIKTFAGGALGGLAIAIPLSIAIDLNFMSMFNAYTGGYTVLAVDVIAIAVMSAISGGVMGLVLGAMTKE